MKPESRLSKKQHDVVSQEFVSGGHTSTGNHGLQNPSKTTLKSNMFRIWWPPSFNVEQVFQKFS